MKLTRWAMMIFGVLFLGAGSCLRPLEVAPIEGPLFCDVEEPRRFTQEEVDWRARFAPANLRRDFRTNLNFERECLGESEGLAPGAAAGAAAGGA